MYKPILVMGDGLPDDLTVCVCMYVCVFVCVCVKREIVRVCVCVEGQCIVQCEVSYSNTRHSV